MKSMPPTSKDDTPKFFKWILFGFIFVFVGSVVTLAIRIEDQYPKISINNGKDLIRQCKIIKIYEVGDPSRTRSNRADRARTMLELNDGSIVQTEFGIRLSAFQEPLDTANCTIEQKPLVAD